MLKITVGRNESATVLVLEGKLAGPWVAELKASWDAEKSKSSDLSVDLGGVSFVDSDGRELLKRIHQQGGKLVAKGCLIRAIVAELTDAFSCEKKGSPTSFTRTKLIIAFFLLAAGAAQSASAQQSAPLRLTLHDAVSLALKQNPQVLIAGIQTSQSVQDQNISRAGLLPQAQLNTSVAVSRANLETAFGERFPGFPEHIGPFEIFNAGTQFSAPILDLTLWNRYQASKQNTAAARADQLSVREQITLLTVSQYLGALRAAAEVRNAESRVALAQALFNLAADLQKNGAGTGIDTLRANVELQNEKQTLLSAETDQQVALFGLSRLLNLDPRQQIEIADELSFFQIPEVSIDDSLDRAYKSRPELTQLDASLRAAQASKQASFDERLPAIQGGGAWNYQGVSISTGIPVYQYQVGVVVPIFTGGRIHAETSRADLEIQKIERRRDDLRNQIALEVKTALAQLESARHQVEVANLGVQLAKEEVSQARDRFAAGVVNNIEVIQAQDALSRANDNQVAALYQFNQSRADLARSIGQMESLYAK
ncbi:MAG TPA: TolC family protein [Candidatus Acidoferrum sp.]|nr:TolC family protein [Candidatus Acidoferrum sp.]